jgi:hypothetical protein
MFWGELAPLAIDSIKIGRSEFKLVTKPSYLKSLNKFDNQRCRISSQSVV